MKSLVGLLILSKVKKNVEKMETKDRKINIFNTGLVVNAEIVQKCALKLAEIAEKKLRNSKK